MYTPLLPAGTRLVVTAGPVAASGYTWFRAAPVGFRLDGGIDQGWVAIADHDGTPWVALAADPTPGYELAAAVLAQPAGDVAAAKAQGQALNGFGLALYLELLRDPAAAIGDKGAVVSPASITLALAMARAGANGETATQMDRVLRVSGWNALSGGLGSLSSLLASRDAGWTEYPDGTGTQHQLALRIANMAFSQQGYPIEAAYLDRIGRAFGSGLGLVDYIRDAEAARQAINGWVSRQTLGRIPELLLPSNITGATRLVLVNAMYLKAEWARPFSPEETVDRPFTTLAGTTVTVPTMTLLGEQDVVLASGAGWQATELRYNSPVEGQPLAMTLILPDDLRAFEAGLTADKLAAIQRAVGVEQDRLSRPSSDADGCSIFPYNVRLYLPRFGIDTRAALSDVLSGLGMPLAFDPSRADFSGITAADRLHIGFVIHQANIDVDEKGTEAAAATAIGMDVGGPGACRKWLTTHTLRLDRPFMFVLRDVETGAILFMGRVTDPSQR
jgi:serpin B